MTVQLGALYKIDVQVAGEPQLNNLNKTLSQTADQADKVDRQSRRVAQGFALLPAQITDIVTQLAGGQSPFLILIQQGGQIKDSFGGIMPTLSAFASKIGVVGLAALGVGVAIGGLLMVLDAGSQRQVDFQNNLVKTANYAGMTEVKFNNLTRAVKEMSGLRTGAARDLVSGAVFSGAFGSESIASVVQAMAQVQRLSGKTAEEVNKDFASMSRGVASWAVEYNRQYNFLTLATYKQIKALELQGQQEAAMKLASDELQKSLKDRTKELGALEEMWKNVRDKAGEAWEAMMNWGKAPTTDDIIAEKRKQLVQLQDQYAQLQKQGAPETTTWGVSLRDKRNQYFAEMDAFPQRIKAVTDQILLLQGLEKGAQDRKKAEAEKAAKERQGIEDELTGRLYKINAAGIALDQAQTEQGGQAKLGIIKKNQALLEQEYASGFLTEASYNQRKLDLRQQELQQELAIASAKRRAEEGRKLHDGDQAEALQQQARIVQMKQQEAELQRQIALIPIEKATEKARDDLDVQRERAKEWASITRSAADYIRTLGQSNAKAKLELDEVNPIERARKLAELEIAEIKRLAQEQIIELKVAIAKAPTEEAAAALQKQLDDVEAARDEAVTIARRKAEPEDWLKGIKRAFGAYVGEASNAGKLIENTLTSAFSKIEDAMVNFFMTGKLGFADLARSILADMVRMITKALILKPLMEAIGSYMGMPPGSMSGGGGGGSPGGVLFGNMFAGLFGFAKGGAFGGSGQVLSSPTLFKFANGGGFNMGVAGEAGPEAVMPLRRGPDGRLGVQAAGGGATNVSVVVNVESGNTQVSGDTQGAALGQLIAATVNATLLKEKRPGGLLAT